MPKQGTHSPMPYRTTTRAWLRSYLPPGHSRNWRTTRTIPAHVPRLIATADKRMKVKRQSISSMAAYPSPNAKFLIKLPGSAAS